MASGEWSGIHSLFATRHSLFLLASEREAAGETRQLRAAETGKAGSLAGKAGWHRRQAAGQAGRPPTAAHLLLQGFKLLWRRLRHPAESPAAEPEHVAEGLAEAATLAAAHHLHHVGHLPMHLQQLVDLLDLGAGARRDALLARGLEDVGAAALLRG